jgi:hypothetical protein
MNTHQRRDFLKLAAAGVIATALNDPAPNANSGGARKGKEYNASATGARP